MKKYFIINRVNETTTAYFNNIIFNYQLDALIDYYNDLCIDFKVNYYNNNNVVVLRLNH